MPGILYVVATPIGNLEDITVRALGVLKSADLILCEDTRTTKKLLSAYGIATKTMSYHGHSSPAKHEAIISRLRNGENLALVSDAGTPCISDPGVLLVASVREAGISVISIPGPSALVTALAGSGLPASDFVFFGFLPHKKGRETAFKEIGASRRTCVFYESTHRILKALDSLAEHAPGKIVVLARELTKVHEEFLRGTAVSLKELLLANPQKQRGEFVVIVGSGLSNQGEE